MESPESKFRDMESQGLDTASPGSKFRDMESPESKFRDMESQGLDTASPGSKFRDMESPESKFRDMESPESKFRDMESQGLDTASPGSISQHNGALGIFLGSTIFAVKREEHIDARASNEDTESLALKSVALWFPDTGSQSEAQ
ncbi:hypothetical protein JM16_008595 [Phytophthora kernoviae]|uniref:Uncharacterized protein n=1 Tax=Phytophthora kernoviae TaxID=325452 RepID=A0A8T0LLJ3_9STRA|nr:hypothetical protein JM16_008595 [Phytophthora kernoviae]